MSLLSPWALLWLGSIPVLIWLWRYATSRRQIRIPSLIPFEHLLRRPPRRRTRLYVNLLFWLQLAALVLIALALAEPILRGHQAKTILVLLDTSASMGSTTRGPSPFQKAKQHLLKRIARKAHREQLFLVTTAPVNAPSQEPISDVAVLRQIIQRISVSDLAGNLSIANRLGEALMGRKPDETLVLTDEPTPPNLPDRTVEFRSFGRPLPNVAIVGVDALEPLCLPATAQILVSVQNFADSAQQITLTIRHNTDVVAEESHHIEPKGRMAIPFRLPEESKGFFEVELKAGQDALSVDDRARISLRGSEAIPVVVASEDPAFVGTIGAWLDACPRISWRTPALELAGAQPANAKTPGLAHAPTNSILITDRSELADSWPLAALFFAGKAKEPQMVLTHWLVDPTHPIGSYLEPLETVAATLAPTSSNGTLGDQILWGVVEGRKVPLVLAASTHGRRKVSFLLDPRANSTSVPLVLVFLNSLQWLTGSSGLITTGEPLIVGPLEPGLVRVVRPDGVEELRSHGGGLLRYDSTQWAGRYRFVQGETTVERLVNFLDPAESNTMERVSTWGSFLAATTPPLIEQAPRQSLVNDLLGFLIVLLVLEWILYSQRVFAKSGAEGLVIKITKFFGNLFVRRS